MIDWNEFRGMDINQMAVLIEDSLPIYTRDILNIDVFENTGIRFDNV